MSEQKSASPTPSVVNRMAQAKYLKQRALRPGGMSMEEMVKASNERVSVLSATYLPNLLGELELARSALHRASEGSGDGAPAAIDALIGFAHDTKGQGATHGYPLLSEIGSIMCEMLKALDTTPGGAMISAETIAITQAQLDAMALFIAKDVKGSGGSSERALIDELRRVSEQLRSSLLKKSDKRT